MAKIEDLLHRRTDLSTFLVHLTRKDGDDSALDNLESIIETQTIEAVSPFGPAAHLEEHLEDSSATQRAVCLTETPLEHVWMMLQDIQGRTVHFEPYGLAITKTTGRKAGFNPVWYSDISVRGRDWPAKAVNDLVKDAVKRATSGGKVDPDLLEQEPIFKLTPFFEQMGPTNDGRRKEFWWEREWRKTADFTITPKRVVAVLAPERRHDHLRAFLVDRGKAWAKRPLLDPRWGLERMIAALAGVPVEHLGPFPDAY